MGKRKYSPEFVKDQMAKWDRPFLPSMNDDESKIFRDRVKAIELYAENMNVAEIEAQTGIKRNSIVRLFEKGMKIAADGKPFGYRALLPYSRVAKPLVGKMQTVFNLHDGLEKRVLDFYFSCDAGRAMKHPDKRTTFKYFITELEIAGHDTRSYPFNLTDGGYRTFVDWLDKKEVEKNMYLARQRNEAKVEDAKTGSENKIMHPTRPYQLIEIDGHRLDLLYAIKTYDAEGNVHYRPAERPWLLAAIDIATRCVVSYRVVFESEYNSADVMKLLEGAILPRTNRTWAMARSCCSSLLRNAPTHPLCGYSKTTPMQNGCIIEWDFGKQVESIQSPMALMRLSFHTYKFQFRTM